MHLTHILVNQNFDSIAMTRNGVTSHDSLSNGTIYVRYDDFIGVFPEVDMSQTSSRALISCRHTELNLILSLMQIQLFLERNWNRIHYFYTGRAVEFLLWAETAWMWKSAKISISDVT